MAAPSLQPPALSQPVGTPAAEWAQETVEAFDPNASTGLVTDASGNPTTDHNKSALGGEPGQGMNAEKTAAQLNARRTVIQPVLNSGPIAHDEKTPTNASSQPNVYTNAQGNPTTGPSANAVSSYPGTGAPLPSATDKSLPPTPAPQLPGGWIRGPESRQHSVIIPETSLYEDVSTALDTVGQMATNVIGSLRNGNSKGETNENANATQVQAPAMSTESRPDSSVPPRSGSPGLLSRAQDMITGFLARPASPGAKLPVPDAPTTTGDAALVGGGAVANTANQLGEKIAAAQDFGGRDAALVGGGAVANTANQLGERIAAAQDLGGRDAALVGGGAVANTANKLGEKIAAQDLGGHDQTGAKEIERAKLEKEGAGKMVSSDSAHTASQFLDAGVPTPDPTKPPKNPGLAGALFPDMSYDAKDKSKGSKLGSTLSPDHDVQEAARKSNQDFSVPISGSDAKPRSPTEGERPVPQPTVTKASDSGVKERLMDVKDMVVAPFAGSRASQEMARPSDPVSPSSPGKTTNVLASNDRAGANPVGVRTAANPHTAHTGLPPTKEEASDKYVGGTAVITSSPAMTKNTGTTATGTSHKDTTLSTRRDETSPTTLQKEDTSSSGENTAGVPIQGISKHGDGQGDIYTHETGVITHRSNPAVNSVSPPGSPNKTVSRLWSRSRRSVDEGTTGTKSSRSRFTEEPSTGSDTASAPTSPSSSRFKVPLKDKIKGELKIISGKVSRNETKVEQGIALKTGQDPTSPTIHKH